MKQIAKIVAYVVLIACVAGFGYGFLSRLPHARGETEPGEPTNTVVLSNTLAGAVNTNAAVAAVRPASSQNWGTFLGMFLLTSISLGLLAAYDLSRYFAHRAEQFVFDENLVVEKD